MASVAEKATVTEQCAEELRREGVSVISSTLTDINGVDKNNRDTCLYNAVQFTNCTTASRLSQHLSETVSVKTD